MNKRKVLNAGGEFHLLGTNVSEGPDTTHLFSNLDWTVGQKKLILWLSWWDQAWVECKSQQGSLALDHEIFRLQGKQLYVCMQALIQC